MTAKKSKANTENIRTVLIFLGLLTVIIVIFSQLHTGFLTLGNIVNNMLKHISITAVVALGLTFVIAVGHYDMSFPWVGTLGGITTAFMIAHEFSLVMCLLAGLGCGLLWGLVNGAAVGRFKMPDVILTIGTGSIAWGWAYIYSDGAYIYDNFLSSGIMELNDGRFLGIPYPVVLMLVSYLIGYFFLHKSTHGRRIYAIGDNQTAAFFSGVKINLYKTAAFSICGVLGAMATIMIVAAQGQGGGRSGLTLLMPAYASVYLGIAVFKRPTILGTFLGATLLAVMLNGFTLLSVPFYSSDLIISITLVIALSLSNETILRMIARNRPEKLNASKEKQVNG